VSAQPTTCEIYKEFRSDDLTRANTVAHGSDWMLWEGEDRESRGYQTPRRLTAVSQLAGQLSVPLLTTEMPVEIATFMPIPAPFSPPEWEEDIYVRMSPKKTRRVSIRIVGYSKPVPRPIIE